jgi:hypothetical protein
MTDDLKKEWKAIVDFYTERLAVAQVKLRDFDLEEGKLTKTQLREKVLKLAKNRSAAFKKGWKKIIDDGMVENVCGILHECYESFLDPSNVDELCLATVREQLGSEDSLKFQEFKFKVIERLFNEGSFGSDKHEEGFHDFEDTAGGCDEIAWDAGLAVLQNLENVDKKESSY